MSRPTSHLVWITSARILLVPAVMALILYRSELEAVAAALFTVAAATDFVDGYLARRWGATTLLGSFLDTTADKLLVTGTLIALVAVDRVSPWIALIIIGRELLIMALRGLVAGEGTFIAPSIWGKWKATVQFVAIGFVIARPELTIGPLLIDEWLMLLAAGITIMSGVEYLVRFAPAFSRRRPVPSDRGADR